MLVSWQFSGPYGVIKYGSGWRKDVVNQCLEFGWKRDKLFTPSQPRAKLEANTNMNKQIIYGSAMAVQLIVLILNKPVLYGRAVDVQVNRAAFG